MSNALDLALDALRKYQKAGIGNSTDFTLQLDAALDGSIAIAELEEAIKQQGEPVAYQFQDRERNWCNFSGSKHYEDTVTDGTWPIRALYASAPTIPAGYMLTKRYFCIHCGRSATTPTHDGCDYLASDLLTASPENKGEQL